SPPPSKMGEVGRGLLLLFLSRRDWRAMRAQGAGRRRQERRALAKTLPLPPPASGRGSSFFSSPIEDGGGWGGAPSSLPLAPRWARRARAGRCAATAGTRALAKTLPLPPPASGRGSSFFSSPIEDGGGWEGAPSSLPFSLRRAHKARAGRRASTAG